MARSLDRQFNFKNFVGTVLLSSLALTAVLGGIRQLGAFEESELLAYDRFLARRQPLQPDDRILVVGINELDIQERKEYPIHDETLASLLKKLESYRPRAIGVDIARDIPQGEEQGRKLLTQVFEQSDRIVSACLLSDKNQPGLAPAPGAKDTLIGFANFPDDSGSIVRRSQLVSRPGQFDPERKSKIRPKISPHLCNVEAGKELPSFSFKLAQMYLNAEGIIAEQSDSGAIQFDRTVLQPLNRNSGGYTNLQISDYQLLLNYRRNYQYFSDNSRTDNAVVEVSLSDILNESIPESNIRGRIVLVGYTSPFVKDSLTTPYEHDSAILSDDDEVAGGFRNMPGIVVHAQAISQILSAVLDERPLLTTRSEPVEMLWIGFWAIVGGAIAFHRRNLLLTSLMVGGAIGACWWSCWYLFQTGLWIPLVPALWAIATTAIVVMLLNQARQGGYTQAIYEELRNQLQGRRQGASTNSSDSFTYLESLVQRAQAIRRAEEVQDTELITESLPESSVAQDELGLDFASPAQQEIYDQIRAEVEEDLLLEQARYSMLQQQSSGSESKQIQDLINRARAARQDDASPPRSSD